VTFIPTCAPYKQRIVPIIHGDVIQVSADRLTDPKTNNPYYVALVRVDENELARNAQHQAPSGHAGDRDDSDNPAHRYIVGPLVMSFNHSFRQK
jgi:membrane fusion protein, epimerase transport system